VKLWEDQEERIVEIPEDVLEVFEKNKDAFEMYQKMSYTHRKEYMRWITEAKKPETRENRKVKLIEMILAGKKEYNLNINAYEIKKTFPLDGYCSYFSLGYLLFNSDSDSTVILMLCGVFLMLSVFSAVHHSEVIAHKIGEPLELLSWRFPLQL
jgi:hypothetical protein